MKGKSIMTVIDIKPRPDIQCAKDLPSEYEKVVYVMWAKREFNELNRIESRE